MHTKQSGFTLTELLLSIVLIGIITGLSAPLYIGFQNRNTLEIASQDIAEMLRRAQTYSRAVKGDSEWGVKVQASNATLFKGNNFALRDTTYDEVTNFPTTITPSGAGEFTFSKLFAEPNTTGSVILTSSTGNIETVTVNAQGMVNY